MKSYLLKEEKIQPQTEKGCEFFLTENPGCRLQMKINEIFTFPALCNIAKFPYGEYDYSVNKWRYPFCRHDR